MITIEETIEFIKKAHDGVMDMGGQPYYLHPLAVYGNLQDPTIHEAHAALLHDVVEDTDYTYKDLIDMGYDQEVIDIVKLVTKEDDDFRPYFVWIQSIVDSGNHSAIKVKKADMEHNTLPERSDSLDQKTRKRLKKKYDLGWAIIMEYENGI